MGVSSDAILNPLHVPFVPMNHPGQSIIPSLPFVNLQHLLCERGEVVTSVHHQGADVQHRQISRQLLDQSTGPSVPHLQHMGLAWTVSG